MNGLLDFIKTPEGQGLLGAAFGGLAGAKRGAPLNTLGNAGMMGVIGYSNALQNQAQLGQVDQINKLRDMQMKQTQFQIDQAKRDAERTQRIEGLAGQFTKPGSPAVPGVAPTKGFTPVDAMLPPEFRVGTPGQPAKPAVAPSFDAQGFANAVMGVDPLRGIGLLQALQKDDAPQKLGAGEVLLSGKASGYKPLFSNPKEPPKLDSKIEQYEYAKARGYKGSLEDYVAIGPTIMANAQAPLRAVQASNIIEENRYTLPPPQSNTGGVSVTHAGKTFSFPNQAAANKFKFEAGIK